MKKLCKNCAYRNDSLYKKCGFPHKQDGTEDEFILPAVMPNPLFGGKNCFQFFEKKEKGT